MLVDTLAPLVVTQRSREFVLMRRRMFICLGVLLALCLVGIVTAMACLHQSIGYLTAVVEAQRIQSMRVELAAGAVEIVSGVLGYLEGRGAANMEAATHNFEVAQHRCGSCHHESSTQASLDDLRSTFEALQVVAWGEAGRRADQSSRANDHLRRDPAGLRLEQLTDELARGATDLAECAEAHLTTQSADATVHIHRAWAALFGTLLGTMVIGGFVALHLHRRLTEPLVSLLEGIDHARRGDLADQFAFEADTEFRALADAFQDAYRDLDEVHTRMIQTERMSATGRLAAGIAHEIGNPLASISAAAQVMRRGLPPGTESEQIKLIMGEIDRISRIIRELLTFSRPGEGAARELVDVGALLDRATSLLAYDKRAKHVRLTSHHNGLPRVVGDADQLLIVFTNIILNAFDAAGSRTDQKGNLTIRGEHESNEVVIRFEDNGPGMNKEQLTRAFDPFYTTKEPGVGTGLGLWTSYRVIQQHSGTIDLQSRKGEGVTVTIRLPSQPAWVMAASPCKL